MKRIAIRQNQDKLITSFECLDANQVDELVENFKQDSIRWYGSGIDIDEEHDGDAIIYKITEYEEFFLESLSVIKTKKD